MELLVVEIFGVVDVVAEVVDDALRAAEEAVAVVDEVLLEVVLDVAVVVAGCLFLRALVHGAVTVTCGVVAAVPVWEAVDVESVIGTKDEQKADALSAIRMALQVSTSLRPTTFPRGRWTAAVDVERRAMAPMKECRRYILNQTRDIDVRKDRNFAGNGSTALI